MRYLVATACGSCQERVAVNFNGAWICQTCSNNAWGCENQPPGVELTLPPIKLWIDDERNEPKGWLRVSNAANAIAIINKYLLGITDISFDHDIGPEGNGYQVACHLEKLITYEHQDRPIKYNIHSQNPPGVQNILAALKQISDLEITFLSNKQIEALAYTLD